MVFVYSVEVGIDLELGKALHAHHPRLMGIKQEIAILFSVGHFVTNASIERNR